MKKILMSLLTAFVFAGITTGANAALITADATGTDNFSTTDFWGVSFGSGSGFIQSVTFDVSSFSGAFFDFDGSSSYANTTSPVIGATSGLLASDISSSFAGTHPTVLTFNFSANAFAAGDSFRFSADTDFIGDPTSGDELAGLAFSVTFEDGLSYSSTFSQTASNQSSTTIRTASVPEPGSLALLALGLIGLGISRKRISS